MANPRILTPSTWGHIIFQDTAYDRIVTGNPYTLSNATEEMYVRIAQDFTLPVESRVLVSAVWRATLLTAPAALKPVSLRVYDASEFGTFGGTNPETTWGNIESSDEFGTITSADAPGVITKTFGAGAALTLLEASLVTGSPIVIGAFAAAAHDTSSCVLTRVAGSTLTLAFAMLPPDHVGGCQITQDGFIA